jgi:peptidyl-prolyl cis-trans isomerase A (cyclophilin A)
MLYLRTICCLIAFTILLNSAAAGTLVQFRTVFGDIEVELYDQDKPVTVQNFLNYIKSGRYENEFMHRLVPGFVVQGGGFTVTNRGTTNWQVVAIPTYPPITNEFGVGQQFSNVYGTIAMAKTSDPNSATSQFFFNLANNSASLDDTNNSGGFTVFGHVIAGTNALNILNNFQYWTSLPAPSPTNLVLDGYYNAPFDTLPVLSSNLPPSDTDLVFVDISLLQVAIQPVTGGEQISWNSATGLTNIVEYTTNFPPVWNTLVITNGTGARMTVTDNSGMPRRFYRVRVVY